MLAWQVSPHEFMQAVMTASGKRFTIEKQSDPVDFLTWLLNTLHVGLTGGKRTRPSIITQCFQGELEVTTEAGTGAAPLALLPYLQLGFNQHARQSSQCT